MAHGHFLPEGREFLPHDPEPAIEVLPDARESAVHLLPQGRVSVTQEARWVIQATFGQDERLSAVPFDAVEIDLAQIWGGGAER